MLDSRFYAENGLRVLNEWLVEGIRKKEPSMSKEKKRIEMYSQVRALLRVSVNGCFVLPFLHSLLQ